jgi:hypothetical protein
MRALAAFVVPTVLVACAHATPPAPVPTKYTLVIDSGFAESTMQDIVDGAQSWGAVVDDITWTIVVVDRKSIDKELESSPPDNTYYVIRTDTAASIPVECAILEQFGSCYDSARIYIAEADIGVTYAGAKKATAHGFGHSQLLQHSDYYDSVMRADLASMAMQPSSEDGLSYCLSVGCPLCKARRHCP